MTAFPVSTQQTKEPCVRNLARHYPALPKQALLDEAQPLKNPCGTFVPRIDVSFDAIQIQVLEPVADQGAQRLCHATLAPTVRSQDVSDFSATTGLMKAEERARTDEFPVDLALDTKAQVLSRFQSPGFSLDHCDRLVDVGPRRSAPIAHGLWVRVDGEKRRSVLWAKRPQNEAFCLQGKGTECGHSWCELRRLTFELCGRQRKDARPGPVKMYRVPPARAWWPAVGAPLERGVRPHFATAHKPALRTATRMCSHRHAPAYCSCAPNAKASLPSQDQKARLEDAAIPTTALE
jgi:hypothetical protein